MIITTADPKFRFDVGKHRYYYEDIEVPGVSSILKAGNLTNIGFIPRDVLERSSRFGVAVHKTTELYDKGILDEDSLDLNLRGCLDAWIKFKADTGFVVEHNEAKVFSKKYFYMGTLDRIGLKEGTRTVVDLKTGLVYPSMAIQLSGYQEAFNEGLKVKDKATHRLVVQLKEDGTYSLSSKDFFKKSDFSVFRACMTLNSWRKTNNGI